MINDTKNYEELSIDELIEDFHALKDSWLHAEALHNAIEAAVDFDKLNPPKWILEMIVYISNNQFMILNELKKRGSVAYQKLNIPANFGPSALLEDYDLSVNIPTPRKVIFSKALL